MSAKKEITISGVLALLEKGYKRPEIAEELGITMADCRRLFQHPMLKGKKPLKQTDFVIVDDITEKEDVIVEESFEESVATSEEILTEVATNTEEVLEEQSESTPSWEN